MTSKYPMIPLGNGLYRVCIPRSAITGRYKIEKEGGMTPAEEKTLEQLRLAAAAIAAFGDAVRGVGRAVRRFCREFDFRFRLQNASTPKERRRLIRDWQRYNRRPALIHNGRKARR